MGGVLLLLAGPLFLATFFVLMLLRCEPFASFFYPCAWYGLIFTFDQLIRRREGRSLIVRCGPGLLLVLVWSAVTWYFFELLNLRLQNWYYVFVIDHPVVRPISSFVSFATVFPGILWIEHYLGTRRVAWHVPGRPVRLSPRGLCWLQGAGLACLLLPLAWPVSFYPLVWLTLVLVLAPVEYRRTRESLLGQLGRGEYGPLLRLLLAGLIAGVFWESLNYWARAKWIYTVPFFDGLKVFEMPVAGFLGFPPFAVECAVVYRFLVWQGLAPRFGQFTERRASVAPVAVRVTAVLAGLALAAAVDRLGVERVTIASVTPRVDQVKPLDARDRAELRRAGVRYLTDLEGWQGAPAWRLLEESLPADRTARLRRLARLYLHQGIGVRYGNLLVEAGIDSLAELAGVGAESALERLQFAAGDERVPTLPQVKVWVRRVPEGG
ncbi:MAG: DUF4332 domain-containing protein [Candidatus Latescibacterota bacterium]